MKPFIDTDIKNYMGSKAAPGTIRTIINQTPPHETFVSGFLGNCAVMRYKRPAKRNYGYDKDRGVMGRWREAYQSRSNGIVNKALQYVSYEGQQKQFFELEYADFLEIIKNWPMYKFFNDKSFTFLDPPYPESTRTGSKRYEHEFYDYQHTKLLRTLKQFPFPVMLCTYPNELYEKELEGWDWRHIDYVGQTRGGPRTERIYMNYPEPTALTRLQILRQQQKRTRKVTSEERRQYSTK